jgi:hypothetical protein
MIWRLSNFKYAGYLYTFGCGESYTNLPVFVFGLNTWKDGMKAKIAHHLHAGKREKLSPGLQGTYKLSIVIPVKTTYMRTDNTFL